MKKTSILFRVVYTYWSNCRSSSHCISLSHMALFSRHTCTIFWIQTGLKTHFLMWLISPSHSSLSQCWRALHRQYRHSSHHNQLLLVVLATTTCKINLHRRFLCKHAMYCRYWSLLLRAAWLLLWRCIGQSQTYSLSFRNSTFARQCETSFSSMQKL